MFASRWIVEAPKKQLCVKSNTLANPIAMRIALSERPILEKALLMRSGSLLRNGCRLSRDNMQNTSAYRTRKTLMASGVSNLRKLNELTVSSNKANMYSNMLVNVRFKGSSSHLLVSKYKPTDANNKAMQSNNKYKAPKKKSTAAIFRFSIGGFD